MKNNKKKIGRSKTGEEQPWNVVKQGKSTPKGST
jgi:hypothetical protein